MRGEVKPFGRVRLTPWQARVWLTLTGAVPGGVTTVDQLLRWVRSRKAQWAAEGYEGLLGSGPECLDALFEWTTGVEMPDPPVTRPGTANADRSVGNLTCHAGGRIELERECVALVLTGEIESERARELRELLGRRGAPEAVT